MNLYGLIGFPLSHSFSKSYFTQKFEKEGLTDCRYENFPLASLEELSVLIQQHPQLAGLNVTIPYKEKVISYLHRLDENAKAIGAVNTIKIIRKDDKTLLLGFNTDAYGFYTSLKPCLSGQHKSALIIGTGGASRAIGYVLEKLGISCLYVSRNPVSGNHIAYADLCGPVLYNIQLVINTSPVGMFPDTNACPDIPYAFITKKHLLFDLIYNPEETEFLRKGKEMGATVINGLQMLHLQADKAWEIWNDPSHNKK
jgi:shikimate dehydrogenase